MRRETLKKALGSLHWLPPFVWQRVTRPARPPRHVVIAVADHFEPGFGESSARRQHIEDWCSEYQTRLAGLRDADGYPFRHTFFFPAEQYDADVLCPLVEHCRRGFGEIEVHLHHGIHAPDTSENTRATLTHFRDTLAAHGCLSKLDGTGGPRYAFVHGNWALANSSKRNRYCGVDDEMQVLADTGCYADFTLPSAPDEAQISKINALYECTLPFNTPAPHRRGRPLTRGRRPSRFPLMIQGPLGLRFSRWPPRIENSELSNLNPPTLHRFFHWVSAAITVAGQPDWVFVKLHCHGLDDRDTSVMFGGPIQRFLQAVLKLHSDTGLYQPHFVSAREMTNVILAACDGCDGSPADYRNYRLRLIADD